MSEDVRFLRSQFFVDQLLTSGITAPFAVLRRIHDVGLTFTWFASVYAGIVVFLAHLFGKKTIVVVGGVDLARFPEIRYGLWSSRWRSIVGRYTLRHADRVLAVDPYLVQQAKALARYDGKNLLTVPTGYDATRWVPGGQKEPMVLTVARCTTRGRMKVKGIDVLLDAAREMDATRFVIVGVDDPLLRDVRNVPDNVNFVPPVGRDELLRFYQSAKVYCQPSMMEGFPNCVCEAMLCECIPVGTTVGGTPTAIGEWGRLVPYGDVPALVGAISSALEDHEGGGGGRRHITEQFSQQRREESLLMIIQELTS